MGTRSLTHIKDEDGEIITTIYRQYDGYPHGHGVELHRFLNGRKILIGFCGDEDKNHSNVHSNGIGCLAASLIGKLKDGKIGNVYVCAPSSKDLWEAYVYEIYPSGEMEDDDKKMDRPFRRKIRRPMMKVMSGKKVLYDGPAYDFTPDKCNKKED